jgi:hypothetical protein
MVELHVVSALRNKRAELAGTVRHHVANAPAGLFEQGSTPFSI